MNLALNVHKFRCTTSNTCTTKDSLPLSEGEGGALAPDEGAVSKNLVLNSISISTGHVRTAEDGSSYRPRESHNVTENKQCTRENGCIVVHR